MHKLLILFILSFTLTLNLFANKTQKGGIYYDVFHGTPGIAVAVVTSAPDSTSYKGDIVIPYYIEYNGMKCRVEGVDDNAFMNCIELTSVVLPDGIKKIGEKAFYHCSQLVSVNMPRSLKDLGIEAFSGCYNLKSITFPSGLKLIETMAFSDCAALKSVVIPKTLTRVGKNAFRDCFGLEEVIVEEGVEDLCDYAFAGCHQLRTVSLPEGLQLIGNGIFMGCSNLSTVSIPDKSLLITTAFDGCSNIKNVKVVKRNNSALKKGYKGFASAGVSLSMGKKVAIYTTHGYQFNPYFFLGIGTGYYGWFKEDVFSEMELFLDVRTTFTKGKCTPFLGMKAGCAAYNNQDWYFSPSAGVRIGISEAVGLNFSLAFDCIQKTDYDCKDLIIREYPRFWEKDLTLNIAIDF